MHAAELAQRRCLILVQSLVGGCLDPVRDFRGGCHAVGHAGERRHCLGALFAAANSHVRCLVGAKNCERVFERLEPAAKGIELFK